VEPANTRWPATLVVPLREPAVLRVEAVLRLDWLRAGLVEREVTGRGAAVAVPWLRATLGVVKLGWRAGAFCAAGAGAAVAAG
jgi:hypothetical protein